MNDGGENVEHGAPRRPAVGLRAPVTRPELSVVVPSFNQAETIQDNLREIARRLEAQGLDFEMVVVSDGSSDDTHAEAAALDDERVRALRYDRNMGKGYALRTGSAAATGEWIAWVDSDLDLDPGRIEAFLATAKDGRLDVVVGSKRHPESEVTYPTRRRVYSWLYQQLVRAMFSLDVRDTQVGMKLFRREVLDEVLPVVLVKRYAFDLEILAVARSFGFERIAEAPIRLEYQFTASGVNPRAIAQALWDTAAVFYRLRLLRFYERRRVLAHRVAAHRPDPLPGLTVVLVPVHIDAGTQAAVDRLRAATPEGTRVLVAAPAEPGDPLPPLPGAEVVPSGGGSRSERIGRIVHLVTTEVAAFVDQDARPSDAWAQAALSLMGDAHVGAVVGPTVARLEGPLLDDAAGILSESRLGVGGARIRHHVGQLREVGDFPASNLFVRVEALQRAVDEGHPLDDDLCGVLRARAGPGGPLQPGRGHVEPPAAPVPPLPRDAPPPRPRPRPAGAHRLAPAPPPPGADGAGDRRRRRTAGAGRRRAPAPRLDRRGARLRRRHRAVRRGGAGAAPAAQAGRPDRARGRHVAPGVRRRHRPRGRRGLRPQGAFGWMTARGA